QTCALPIYDHVRRVAPARHADPAARDLRRIRALVRRGARDRRRARRVLVHPPAGGQMAALRLDVTVPLRTFPLRVALEVGAETVGIVGPSGAGKSTLLRAVAGLVGAEGSVRVGEDDWSDL